MLPIYLYICSSYERLQLLSLSAWIFFDHVCRVSATFVNEWNSTSNLTFCQYLFVSYTQNHHDHTHIKCCYKHNRIYKLLWYYSLNTKNQISNLLWKCELGGGGSSANAGVSSTRGESVRCRRHRGARGMMAWWWNGWQKSKRKESRRELLDVIAPEVLDMRWPKNWKQREARIRSVFLVGFANFDLSHTSIARAPGVEVHTSSSSPSTHNYKQQIRFNRR